jgi:hypothetical protein
MKVPLTLLSLRYTSETGETCLVHVGSLAMCSII